MMKRKFCFKLILLSLLLNQGSMAQVMETEDGKPLEHRQFMGEFSGNYETSPDEKLLTFPLNVGYGISERFTLELEPTLLTSINLVGDTNETGIGDFETKLFYRIADEKKASPSLAIAGDFKIPVAKNRYIGTGKADFTPIFIAGKTFGRFSTYINLRYTFVGKPEGIPVNNFGTYDGALVYASVNENFLFAEVYGNTSAIRHIDSTDLTLPSRSILGNSEFSGGQTVFSLGFGFHVHNGIVLSMAASYSNTNSLLLSAGIAVETGEKKKRTGIWQEIKKIKKKL